MLFVWLLLAAPARGQDPAAGAADVPPAPTAAETLREVVAVVERFRGVEVRARGGVLILEGRIPSVSVRDELVELAARQPGVVFVDDRMDVIEARAAPVVDADRAVADRIRGVFAQVPELAGVRVEARAGVVRLSGEVLQQETREQALALVRGMPEVVFVDDDLRLVTSVGARLRPAFTRSAERLAGVVAMLPVTAVALVLMGAFAWAGQALRRWDRPYGHLRDKPLVRAMVGRVVALTVTLIGIVAGLEIVGATGLVGGVMGAAGVLGVAVGFAFRDIVENYLAGILLSLQQPFGANDFVEVEGITGVVVRMTMRNTLLLTVDGNHVYVPNATVFKSPVRNFSRNPHRRFDFTVGVGVNEPLADVLRLGVETLRGVDGVVGEPPPVAQIRDLGDSDVVISLVAWVDQRHHDLLAVRSEAIRQVKAAFDRAGYDLPEPIYRVAMVGHPAAETRARASAGPPPVDTRPQEHVLRQAAEERRKEGGDLLAPDPGSARQYSQVPDSPDISE